MKIVHAGIFRAIVLPALIGAVLSLSQQARLLEVSGVNPDLALVGMAVAAALAPGLVNYAFLFLSAVIFIQPLSLGTTAALAAIGAAFYIARTVAPWRAFVRLIVSLAAGTLLFYALADTRFLTGMFGTVFVESAYNVILGAAAYAVTRAFYRPLFGPYEAPE